MGTLTRFPNLATLSPQSHNQPLHGLGDVCCTLTHSLLEHFGLVVIDSHPRGLRDEGLQLLAVEHGKALAWIKNKGDLQIKKLLCMIDHGLLAVWCNDGDLDVMGRINHIQVGMVHGAGVKCGDLIVVTIGHDHRLGRVGVRHLFDELRGDPQTLQSLQINLSILTHGGHGQGLTPEDL